MVLTACFKKAEVLPESKPISSAALRESESKTTVTPVATPTFDLLNKEQREAIYFAASLEKEALRLMTKNQFPDDMSLFSVLSYSVEIAAGIKKSSPTRLDCTRFRFAKDPNNKKIIQIFKTCEKPEKLVTTITVSDDANHMTVTFLIKEWASVVGLSVAVTGTDVVCDLQIKNKKLSELNCLHWTKNLVSSDITAEELRLKTFTFYRDQQDQLLVKGGIFKDLTERKKIEMRVPLEGKIKIFEKEIEVIDEFAEKPIEHNPTPVPIKPVPAKNEINKLGDMIEKNSQQENQQKGEVEIRQEEGRSEIQKDSQKDGQQEGQQQQGQKPEENGQQGEAQIQIEQDQGQSAEGEQSQQQNGQSQKSRKPKKPLEGRQNNENGGIPPEGR